MLIHFMGSLRAALHYRQRWDGFASFNEAMNFKRSSKVARSPAQKAVNTARWARIMTKWLITHSSSRGVKWRLVEFGGKTGSESVGIVDMIAIRKNHKIMEGVRRGDLFDLVLIQIKGGSAASPSSSDIARMRSVAKHHRANEIVLVEWKIRERLAVHQLVGSKWKKVDPSEIFGLETTKKAVSIRSTVFQNPASSA